MARRLFREERLQLIIERVLQGKRVVVTELADEFGVSPSSIRLDLAELEARHLLTRTHGGAIRPDRGDEHLVVQKPSFELRQAQYRAEKDAIGRATADLIEDGDTLMIDGGSTTFYVVQHLVKKRNLSVITNAVSLLPGLMAIPDTQIFVTGGLLNRPFATLLGDIAVEVAGRFRTAKAILGMDGISLESGLSVTDPWVAATKRKMMLASEQVIVACDHTKLGQDCLIPLAPLEEMSYLVTDDGMPASLVEAVRARGPQVVVASLRPER